MSRFSEWNEDDYDPGQEATDQTHLKEVADLTEQMITRPGKALSKGEPSVGVLVSAEEVLIGISSDGWTWLADEVGCNDEELTSLLLAHNRQSPSRRISGEAADAGAADLMAWLVSEAEKSKNNITRVALIPSALAAAMNERDAKLMGPPPARN